MTQNPVYFPKKHLVLLYAVVIYSLLAKTSAQNLINVKVAGGTPGAPSGAAVVGSGGDVWNYFPSVNGRAVGGGVVTNASTIKDSTGATLGGVTMSLSLNGGAGVSSYTDTTSFNPNPSLVMGNYLYEGSGTNYWTFTFAGLPSNKPYMLYGMGNGNASGQGTTWWVNVTNGHASASATANFSGGSRDATQATNQGICWVSVPATTSAAGALIFRVVELNGNESGTGGTGRAYFDDFQLQPLSAPLITGLSNVTAIAGATALLSPSIAGVPTPACQWQSNGVNIVRATNASLSLPDIQYSQNGNMYALIASNLVGVVTNNMTLTVIVTPAISGINNQAVPVDSTVTIPATVSGVPTPATRWQFNGANVTDGVTGDGSTISGSATGTLTITSAQSADSGTYSIVASNSAGISTNGMTLTVSTGNVSPDIVGPANQMVVQGSNAVFTASVTGLPVPGLQWQQNGVTLAGQTNAALVVTNVQPAQSGNIYSIIATNSAGMATNRATLTVLVAPVISMQPTNIVATAGLAASFSVASSGVPTPAYQWHFASNAIPFATGSTYTIPSVSAGNMGGYYVVVSNSVGSVTSSAATLTVDSPIGVVSLTPSNGATRVCYDTPLYITFSSPPALVTPGAGQIRIYNVTNTTTPVDILDMSQNVTLQTPYAVNVQSRTIGGESFYTFPVIITGNTAALYPHLDLLTSNQTYYVTVDGTVFSDTNGAYFTGISGANGWSFTTKPTGPANATNLVVAQDDSGDFATVQGAIDSVPANSTTPTLINIRNGNYTEIVEAHAKNNLTFLGQTRSSARIQYLTSVLLNNNANYCMVFKVNASDISIENLTITNLTPQSVAQAFALMMETGNKRLIVNNAEISGYQDTILINTSDNTAYFDNSLIQGDVDYIWGSGAAFFTNCQMNTLRSTGGYVTQPRTPAGSNGFAFVNCSFTVPNSTYHDSVFARAIGIPNGNVALIDCRVDTNGYIGWNVTDVTNVSLDLRWWEYGNSNLMATAPAVFNGTRLAANSPNLTNAFTAAQWLNGWQPQLAPAIYSQPASQTVAAGQTVSLSVGAVGVPAPACYQWLLNGTNVPGATNAILMIPNAYASSAGNYSAVVSNSVGGVVTRVAVVSVAAVSSIPTPQYNYDNVINITNYGAVGDGVTTTTTAIQDAINAATSGGVTNGLRGGTVEIPPGTYLSGPITLANDVNLQMDSGAMLQMLPIGSYPGGTTNPPDFIFGQSLHDIAITGPGTIDGNGAGWQSVYSTNSSIARPRAMFAPQSCTNVLVQDVTLQNPPNTHISFRYACLNVTVNHININTPEGTHNTDGIDMGASNVIIANSHISDGDDHVAMDGCFGVTITNCLFGTGHGVSIGSYTSEGVSNLLVVNCVWTNGTSGIHLKSDDDRGGLVQNLSYINLAMTNTETPISFYSYYTNIGIPTVVTPALAASYPALPVTATTPIWRNIYISNLTAVAGAGSSYPAGMIWGKPEMSFSNVVMDHVNITASNYFEIYNAQGIQLIDSTITGPSSSALALFNAGLVITNRLASTNLVLMEGVSTNGIGNGLALYNAQVALTQTNLLADTKGVVLDGAMLTVRNNLSLSSSDIYTFVVGSNASTVEVNGNLATGGASDIVAGGGFANGSYTLMTYTGNLTGALPMLGATPPGFNCTFSTNVAGELNLVVGPPPPGIPANVVAEGTNLMINLQWSASANAASYNVKRSPTNGGPYALIASVSATNISDTAVNPGTAYYYVVSATNVAGESPDSMPASAVPLPSLVSTNLSLQVSANQLQLSWPQDHLGWKLQIQTNSLAGGLGTNWVDWPESTNVFQTNIVIDPGNGGVFLRLVYP